MPHGMTMAEKILARASGRDRVRPGEYVTARIDSAMMPDAFRLIRKILAKAGIKESEFRIWVKERFVAITDHRVPASLHRCRPIPTGAGAGRETRWGNGALRHRGSRRGPVAEWHRVLSQQWRGRPGASRRVRCYDTSNPVTIPCADSLRSSRVYSPMNSPDS